jgi:hypothetical protein
MQCNIDDRGRSARRWTGVACAVVAALLLALAALWWHAGLAITAGGFAAGAALCFWQAHKGYCVVRAMGIKTPV